MDVRQKIIVAFVALAFFSLGVFLAYAEIDFPILALDKTVELFDIANLMAAILLAIFIPFVIQKALADKKDVKTFLSEEFKLVLSSIDAIDTILKHAVTTGALARNARESINMAFHEAEIQMGSIENQLDVAYGVRAKTISRDSKKALFIYKQFLTGGKLMNISYKSVDTKYYRQTRSQSSKVRTKLKVAIQKVFQL